METERTMVMILMMTILIGVAISQKRSDVCVDVPNDTAQRPKIAQQFKVDVECNMKEHNGTMYVKEYYDYQRNRGRMTITAAKTVTELFMDYDQGLILMVTPQNDQCVAGPLMIETDRFLFGSKLNGMHLHMFSPSAALHFSNSNESYVGNATIRGIQTDHWTSCQYLEALNATATVDWYFSDSHTWIMQEWTGPSPVRMTAVGKMVLANQTVVPFNHVYDFFNYLPTVSDTDFEVPDGVYCPERNDVGTITPFPKVPDHFSFVGEIVDLLDNKYTTLEETYDDSGKFAMYQFKMSTGLTDANRYSELNDYNSGVSYLNDNTDGTCKLSPISEATVVYAKHVNGRIVRMETPREFFLDDVDYQYTGTVKVRNIPAERWVGVTSKARGFEGQNMTLVWDFATQDVHSWNDALLTSFRMPIQLRMFTPSLHVTWPTYYFNLFFFNLDVLSTTLTDTSICFNDTQRLSLRFFVPKFQESIIRNNVYQAKQAIQSAISLHTGIARNRVTDIQLYFNPDSVEMTMDMLDTTPAFNDVAGVTPQNSLPVAFHLLNDSFNNGTFTFNFTQGSTAQSITPQCLQSFSLNGSLSDLNTNITCIEVNSSLFSAGVLAGVAVGTLVAGGLGGAGAAYLFFK